MPNWKKIVSSSNSKQFRWPAGWQTRDEVAEELECSRERVSEILAPAIEQGLIERKQFPVWDPNTHRKVMVIGYREVSAEKKQPTEGAKVRRKYGSGQIGVLSKDGKKWKITWPGRAPTFPSKTTFEKYLEVL